MCVRRYVSYLCEKSEKKVYVPYSILIHNRFVNYQNVLLFIHLEDGTAEGEYVDFKECANGACVNPYFKK
jgi:hypothetical protein